MSLSDVVSRSGLAGYAEVALLLFMAAFLGVVWTVWRRGTQAEWDSAARMPLDDGPSPVAKTSGSLEATKGQRA